MAGVGFALMAFKPHLFIGFGVVWLMNLRRWREQLMVTIGLTALLVVLAATALLMGAAS